MLRSVLVLLLCANLGLASGGADVDEHYNTLTNMLDKKSEALNSAMLTQVYTHIGLKNPMQTIYDTCMQMRKEVIAERKIAISKEKSDVTTCEDTLARYKITRETHLAAVADHSRKAAHHNSEYTKLLSTPAALNATRVAILKSVQVQEKVVKREQKNRNYDHSEFLKLRAAFETALAQLETIGRVLNGQGSLGDRHGQAFIEQGSSCSASLARMSKASKEVPALSSMLQVFSKSVQKVEKVAKVGGKEAKTQTSSRDMDAINTILAKVRENLIKALAEAQKAENKLIEMWKTNKRSKRKTINNDHIDWSNNYIQQGVTETSIGVSWEKEGRNMVSQAKNQGRADYFKILHEFLTGRCQDSRQAHLALMTNKANELNALEQVILYLNEHVFPKWSKKIVDVASTPYQWKVEKAHYVDVSNTFSAVAFSDNDPTVCRKPFSTVFSKIRILTLAKTKQKFIDPNDLTHSTNKDIKREESVDVDCQLFPTGIPVGRAHSCSDQEFAHAQIDLTGTPYKFSKGVVHMFKPLGRKTSGSKPELSTNGQILTLKIRGRCGDLYGDDAGADADYRSDPIPLEQTGTSANSRRLL